MVVNRDSVRDFVQKALLPCIITFMISVSIGYNQGRADAEIHYTKVGVEYGRQTCMED